MLLYRTRYGEAYLGDSSTELEAAVADRSVQLFMTSPPFALHHTKEYGNKPADEYVDWFKQFASIFWRKLKDDGSLVIDLGGAWNPGVPTRSLYQFRLLLTLCEGLGDQSFHLAQEFYWYNPAKLPAPAQWVSVERIRVKDAVNTIWWLSKTPRPKADNRRILKPYSKAMRELLKRQRYNHGKRPSGHRISESGWKKEHGGSIPANAFTYDTGFPDNIVASEAIDHLADQAPNWLEIAGTGSNTAYHRRLREAQRSAVPESSYIRPHPARFPLQIPAFFIDFLTDNENDLVVDPFAGSNVTGEAAERAGRRWKSFEIREDYLLASALRFEECEMMGHNGTDQP